MNTQQHKKTDRPIQRIMHSERQIHKDTDSDRESHTNRQSDIKTDRQNRARDKAMTKRKTNSELCQPVVLTRMSKF